MSLKDIADACDDPLVLDKACEVFKHHISHLLRKWRWKENGKDRYADLVYAQLLYKHRDVPKIARCPCETVLDTARAAAKKVEEFEKDIDSWKAPCDTAAYKEEYNKLEHGFTAAMVLFDKYMQAFNDCERDLKMLKNRQNRNYRTRREALAKAIGKGSVPDSLSKLVSDVVLKHDGDDSFPVLTITDLANIEVVCDDEVEASQFENPVCVTGKEKGLSKKLRDFVDLHEEEFKVMLKQGIDKLQPGPQQKGKKEEPSHFCMRSYGFKEPFTYDFCPNGKNLSENPAVRGLFRVFQVNEFSMDARSFPCHGVGGFVVCLTGTITITLVPPDIADDESDLVRYLADGKDPALAGCVRVLMTPGTSVYVPFGFIGCIVGISEHRKSKDDEPEEAGEKRGRPKKSETSSKDEKEYCSSLFLPCFSTDGSKFKEETVRSVMARLALSKAYLPSRWQEMEGWQVWHSVMSTTLEEHDKRRAAQAEDSKKDVD